MEDKTTEEKIGDVQRWLDGIKESLNNENISYSELAQIDYVHETVIVWE